MNYLIHFLLAGDDEELRLGNLLGEYVKGASSGSNRFISALYDEQDFSFNRLATWLREHCAARQP